MKLERPLYDVREIHDLREMLRGSVELYGDKVAFLTKPILKKPYVPVTFKQFGHDVDSFGSSLMKLGVKAGTRVAIMAETRYEWWVSYLSIVNGAGTVVPLDKELPVEDVRSMFKRAEVSVVIYSDKYRDKVLEAGKGLDHIKAYCLMDNQLEEPTPGLPSEIEENGTMEYSWKAALQNGSKLLEEGYRDFLDYPIDPDEMRIMLFTSGTTDDSKCVMHSHGTISANLMAMCQMVFIGDDIFLSVLPLHHTYECTCGYLCQVYRGCTVAQNEGLRYILDNLAESKTTCMLTVPLLMENFHKRIWKAIDKKGMRKKVEMGIKITRALRKIGIDLRKKVFADIHKTFGGHLRMMITGGAAINPQVLQDLIDFGFLAIQGYGLTECGPIIALNRDIKYQTNSAGLPMPGVDIKVHNPDEYGVGEFIGKGPNVMLGYYGNPELTAASIKDGYFYTGDLGYMTDDNFVIITGRKKNVIVTKNGKNVYPEGLEALLCRNPEIAEAVVSGEETKDGNDLLVAVEIYPDKDEVEATLGKKNPTEEEVLNLMQKLVTDMNHQVSSFEAIKKVSLRDTPFTKNTTQKILRSYRKKDKQKTN